MLTSQSRELERCAGDVNRVKPYFWPVRAVQLMCTLNFCRLASSKTPRRITYPRWMVFSQLLGVAVRATARQTVQVAAPRIVALQW